MRRSNQNKNNVSDTIENWDLITYNNPLLIHIWQLLPGFILWQIWKEWNKRIFHSKASTPDTTWEKIVSLIKETVRSKSWKLEDLNCNQEEQCVLQSWQPNLINRLMMEMPKHQHISPTIWTPPPIDFIKINFNGASKGNPGPAGYGATLINSNGEILCLVAGFLGETTNNVAELTGLLWGLQVETDRYYHKLILEGDSQIVIKLITKILHGGNPLKISPSWRLSGLLEDFGSLLRTNLSITPSHVKREANKVEYCLTNEGATMETEDFCWEAHTSEDLDISDRCQTLANRDLQPLDGVTHRKDRTCGNKPGCAINNSHWLPSLHH